ncbi:DNA cytosine methyltransferase [Ligilactobacillus salivarius]|uniref:DNA cytosine methyltransferase n=1 Tax=Ligilactobacillus salivarius TaxID=1624 RepID=UPI0039FCEC09
MQGNNRIDADRPAPTIRAEHHGNIEAHYRTFKEDPNDMTGWRRLSVRECARLQSFLNDFIFTISASSAYKAIGNAVPPVLAWNIARSVIYTLDNIN